MSRFLPRPLRDSLLDTPALFITSGCFAQTLSAMALVQAVGNEKDQNVHFLPHSPYPWQRCSSTGGEAAAGGSVSVPPGMLSAGTTWSWQ